MKDVLRLLTALVFMASGFVKAVDSLGFSFKLEEYFSPSVFNLPFLEHLALSIAVAVSALEIILGTMLLLRIKVKQTIMALLALCVFFAFLTFYSAYFNVVTDCGCFGDALKLTPWQSFWKDITLLVILIFLLQMYHSGEQATPRINKILLAGVVLLIAFITFWGIAHEPLIDFRDYQVGTDLNAERKKIAATPSEYKTIYTLKNKSTGEEREVNQDEYLADDRYWKTGTEWEIQKNKTTSKVVKEGYKSEVAKFKISGENGEDLTDAVLKSPRALLIFSYKPEALDGPTISEAENKIIKQTGFKLGVSTAPRTFSRLRNGYMDGTAIKTIARSNPFILVLEDGKITYKMPLKDFK